jgi:hypothetical protein
VLIERAAIEVAPNRRATFADAGRLRHRHRHTRNPG